MLNNPALRVPIRFRAFLKEHRTIYAVALREIHANCVKFTHAGSSGGLLLRTRQLEGKVRCDPQDRIEGILRYNTRQSPGSLRSEGRRGISSLLCIWQDRFPAFKPLIHVRQLIKSPAEMVVDQG